MKKFKVIEGLDVKVPIFLGLEILALILPSLQYLDPS